jgi:hypothetical protein
VSFSIITHGEDKEKFLERLLFRLCGVHQTFCHLPLALVLKSFPSSKNLGFNKLVFIITRMVGLPHGRGNGNLDGNTLFLIVVVHE